MHPLTKKERSFLDRLFTAWLNQAEDPEEASTHTTRPEWISGKRAPARRPFRPRSSYAAAGFYDRPPVSYGPYSPYALD